MADPIRINLQKGYWPHFVPAFLDRYGRNSVFAHAVSDCLMARQIEFLIKQERIPANTQPLQFVPTEATAALEALFDKMTADGAKNPVLHIRHESYGAKEPGVLEAEVDRIYGAGAFTRWLNLFEREEFAQALKFLSATH